LFFSLSVLIRGREGGRGRERAMRMGERKIEKDIWCSQT